MMKTKTDSSRKTSAKNVGTAEAGGIDQGPGLKQVPEEVETGRLVHPRTPSSRGLFYFIFFKTLYLNVWRGIGLSHLSVSTNLWYIYCLLVQVLW